MVQYSIMVCEKNVNPVIQRPKDPLLEENSIAVKTLSNNVTTSHWLRAGIMAKLFHLHGVFSVLYKTD